MVFRYKPKGVCSQEMIFDINEDNTINNLEVIGGCDGNLKGINQLLKGMSIDFVINRLEGVKCRFKNTSCPDQIAQALKEFKTMSNETYINTK